MAPTKKRLFLNISDTSCILEKQSHKKNKFAETVIVEDMMDFMDVDAEFAAFVQHAVFLWSSSNLQEALMSLVNMFNIFVSRCGTLKSLRVWTNMEERLNREETLLRKHLVHIMR